MGVSTAICPEELGTSGEPTPIKFTTKAPVATRTSADGNNWTLNDSVGIYMLTDEAPQLIGNSLNSNRKYFVQGNGVLEDLKPFGVQALYYQDPTNLRFISYYPYLPNIIDYRIPIDVRKQDRPQDIDVLYSSNAKQIVSPASGGTSPVRLIYRHLLSKLIIDVRKGTNTDINIHGMTAEIENQPLTTSFHLDSIWSPISSSGVVGFFGTGTKPANYDTTYQAILIPHDPIANAQELIQLRTQRRLFSWKLPPEMDKFESGMVYHFQLTLLGETDIQFKGEIKPWDDASLTGSGDVDSWQDDSGAPYPKIIREGLDTLAVRYMKGGSDQFQVGSTKLPPTANHMSSEPVHFVELSANFHISETPITVAQYCKFLNDPDNQIVGTVTEGGSLVDVSAWIPGAASVVLFAQPGTNNNTIKLSGTKWIPAANGQFPMAAVSWYGAQAYARWAGGNLPTEAQWEFTARDGVIGTKEYIDPTGYDGANLAQYANFAGTTLLPVRDPSLLPSDKYNMYGMFGNVSEWCYDRFAAEKQPYPGNPGDVVPDPNNPQGGAPAGDYGVTRGGNYESTLGELFIGARRSMTAANMDPKIGFRVVFTLQ
ncbi:hypothetical protein FACS1894181_08080 [Bacteroidia bacterium]|nr:hypothetical protein FACS1894181_08080 [Bacteroidia bacterium]